MSSLSDYEIRVLRFYRGDVDTGIVAGGALDEARMSLRAKGYFTFGEMRLTSKATEFFNQTDCHSMSESAAQ